MTKSILFFCLVCWIVGIVYLGFLFLYDKEEMRKKFLKAILLSLFAITISLLIVVTVVALF